MPMIGPLKLKVQVFCADTIAMGPGKADLLEAIDRAGSISGAGRELAMSYRRAWLLVAEMNRCWLEPLVDAKAGGGERGGARLTAVGREVLTAYRKLEADLASASGGEDLAALTARLRDQPRTDPESD